MFIIILCFLLITTIFFVFLFNHTIIVDVIIAYDILCMWCI